MPHSNARGRRRGIWASSRKGIAAGLGTVSHCPLPTYLLQAGDARRPDLLDLDRLDRHPMYGQILTLARTIQALDATPSAAL